MNLKNLIIALAVSVGIISPASAIEPMLKLAGDRNCWPDCLGKYCCDDYHPKPLPCAAGVQCFECPDFCRKPFPCLPPVKTAFRCDDFCPKPLPPICGPSPKNLRCIPSRLPPISLTAPKAPTAPAEGLLPADEAGIETLPVSSSRRVRRVFWD